MNPYLVTVTFLLMMSFLTSSEAIRFAQNSSEYPCYLKSRDYLVTAEEMNVLCHLDELREEENPTPKHRQKQENPATKTTTTKRIRRLNINTARPPDNSRLNIYMLLHKEPHSHLPKEFSLYEVFARLMRMLYHDAPFFNSHPNIEYRILDKLIEKKEDTQLFTTPDELSALNFDDPDLQEIFYHMLHGTRTTPSFLHYITFDKIDSPQKQSRKISLFFVDPMILQAIFPEGQTCKKLLAAREKIWEEILDQEAHRLERPLEECKGRKAFDEDLTAALKEVLISEGLNPERYKNYVFDLTLGLPGSVMFIENLLTGQLTREKYIPPQRATKS